MPLAPARSGPPPPGDGHHPALNRALLASDSLLKGGRQHWGPVQQALALKFLSFPLLEGAMEKHSPLDGGFTSWVARGGRDGGNICHVLVAGGSLRKIPGRDFTNPSHLRQRWS